jgi:ribosome-associated toxin RatA of RatAB toxin-antitoxin module
MDAGIVLRSLLQRYVPSQNSEPRGAIMARIERSIEIEAPVPVVQEVIWDFARYPEFVPHLEQAETLQTGENTKRVRFTVNILRRLSYTLDLKSTAGKGLVWSLAEGPFQRNKGGWALQALGPNRTRATYNIDARLTAFTPRFIEDRLIAQSLPETLKAFRDEAERRAPSVHA